MFRARFIQLRYCLLHILLACCFLINEEGSNADNTVATNVPDVSLIQLIATPERFSGRYIRVIGYLECDEGSSVLYLSSSDAMHGVDKNALWLYPNKEIKPTRFDHKYVIVQGVFSSKDKGHWDIASGSLHNVDRMDATRQ